MPLVNHIRQVIGMSVSLGNIKALLPQMLLYTFATCVPLLVGYFSGHLLLSVYASLTGYLLALSDPLGRLQDRVQTLSFTFLILGLGVGVGAYLHGQSLHFGVALGLASYWIGLLGGQGGNLEKTGLFGTIMMMVANSSPGFSTPDTWAVVLSSVSSFLLLILGVAMISMWRGSPSNPASSLQDSFRLSLTLSIKKHIYAVIYSCLTLVAFFSSASFGVSRPYWAALTVLIILRPDAKTSLQRNLQRFVGTILGVLAAEALIYLFRSPLWVIGVISIMAFVLPWAAKKSYWVMSFVVSVLVLMLIELPNIHKQDFKMPLERLYATAWGCVFALIGVFLSFVCDLVLSKTGLSQKNE